LHADIVKTVVYQIPKFRVDRANSLVMTGNYVQKFVNFVPQSTFGKNIFCLLAMHLKGFKVK